MSKIKLDLSQFKHVKSQNGMTTLRHRDGHTLTIADKALSPEGQAQLTQLAKAAETPLDSDELKHKDMADGGEIDFSKAEVPEKKENESPTERHLKNAARVTAESMQSDSGPRAPMIGGQIEFAQGGRLGPNNPKLAESKKTPPSTSYVMPPSTPMAQGGNAGEKRKEIFGTKSSPSNPEMRKKHMEHISKYSEKNFGMPIQPSGGKINPKTGERRDSSPELGVDKPDWRSGQLEAQSNPDAMVHELAHLLLLPKGMPLKEGQKYMDKQYADVQKNFGYMKQKQSQGEIQPMAIENILRRHLGLPAATQSVPVKEGQGPRMAVDTGTEAAVRVPKGEKTVDLIRQSRLLSPENRKRMEEYVTGKIKFHPETGWQDNPEALGALSSMYKEEHPEAVKKMADGGQTYRPQTLPTLAEEKYTAETSPGPSTDYSDVTTPEQDAARRQQQDAEDEAFRASQQPVSPMAEGGKPKIEPPHEDTLNYEQLKKEYAALKKRLGEHVPKQVLERKRFEDGGKVSPNISDEPPASLQADSEDLTPTSVPTEMTGEAYPKMSDEQTAYKQGHDRFLQPVMPNTAGGPLGALATIAYDRLRKGATPEEQERNAAEAGLNNVALMKEDKTAEALKKEQEQVRIAKINSQLQSIGQPPLPGTNQPNAVDATPMQPLPEQAAMPKAGPTPSNQPDDFSRYENMMESGYRKQLAGINKAAEVAGQRGALEQQALEKDLANKQLAEKTFQDSFQELNNERQAHISDIQNGYIDPKQYWTGVKNPVTGEMEGGHSKLMAGIGMILAGFNPTSNPNQAVQMLQYQMNRNLEAQKANLGAKQNLLMANLQQFHNLHDATDMTRIMQHDMVANELQQAAAKTASPAAKAAALQASGQLQMSVPPMLQQFAMRRAFMKLANGGDQTGGATEQMLNYMEATGMPQAKEMRERYVPGLGIAATPVPQETKDRITAYQNVERLMNQAMSFAKEHEYNLGSLNPSERAAGETIRNELMSQIRTAEKQGVYKESEAKFMQNTLGGNPAAFFSAVRTQPKLLEMQQMKTNEYHNLLQNLGGNLLRNAQSVHAQVHSTPQNIIHDANGKPFTRQIINGKAYMVPVGVSR